MAKTKQTKNDDLERNDPRRVEMATYKGYPVKGLSLNAYAKHRKEHGFTGINSQTVSRSLKVGIISKNEHQKIDPLQADIDWFNNSNQSRSAKSAKPTPKKNSEISNSTVSSDEEFPKLAESTARVKFLDAELKQLKLDEASGLLITREESYSTLFDLFRVVRDQLMNIPVRLGPELASIVDPIEIEKVLEKELEQVLTDLSKEGSKLADGAGE